MMLLANEIVAADLTERGVPAIYRIHGRPDERKIALFCELARSMGHDLDPDDATDPKVLASFLAHVDESPEAPVLRYLLLRSMQQAAYDVNPNVGHFGLAARDYLHFTSPIRRYPDLAVHRVVRAVLRREPLDGAMLFPRLRMMASESSRLERRAMSVERDVVKLYATILMRDHVGDVLDASISAVESHGFHVTLDSPFVECWVPLEELSTDRYELDDLGLRLTSWSGHSYGLGDRLRVRIVRVNLDRREILAVPDLETAEEAPRRTRRSRTNEREARDVVEPTPRATGRRRGPAPAEPPARELDERTVRRGRHVEEEARGPQGSRKPRSTRATEGAPSTAKRGARKSTSGPASTSSPAKKTRDSKAKGKTSAKPKKAKRAR
jgi:ribonuclease R